MSYLPEIRENAVVIGAPIHQDDRLQVREQFIKENYFLADILTQHDVPVGKFNALYAFISDLKPGLSEDKLERLDELDRIALGAAEAARGLKLYLPNPGISICLWEGSTDAASAIRSPEHRKAAAYAGEVYAYWELNQWLIGRLSASDTVEFIPRSYRNSEGVSIDFTATHRNTQETISAQR